MLLCGCAQSPKEFVYWAMGDSQTTSIIDFYTNPAVRTLYKNHISAILTRCAAPPPTHRDPPQWPHACTAHT